MRLSGLLGFCASMALVIGAPTTARAQSSESQPETRQSTVENAAVEKAQSFEVDKVVAASPGIELTTAPEGYVKIHPNHHLWSKLRVGEVLTDGQYKVLYESELLEPNPFPKGYQ